MKGLLAAASLTLAVTACSGASTGTVQAARVKAINEALISAGAAPTAVRNGTGPGSLRVDTQAGVPVVLVVACAGRKGSFMAVHLNSTPMTEVTCDSDRTGTVMATATFPAPGPTVVVSLEPKPGQHWWAALSPKASLR